jgi:starch synthase
MKIIFCSSEVFPFAKTGGLGDVCGSLPLALEKIGADVSIFLPGYRCIGRAGSLIEPLTADVSRSIIGSNVRVYFVGHEKYFDREGLYGNTSGDYPDNIERFSFFCDQVLQLAKQLDLQPDVIHSHDWQTALIPVYLKEKYKDDAYYADTKTLLTIHNLAFQGVFPKELYPQLGLDGRLFCAQGFEFYGQVNLLKAGIIYSDHVTTVSPRYAKEIRTKEFGCGLEDVLRGRRGHVAGILNGLDHNVWNPAIDGFIVRKYSADDVTEGKSANKAELQKELGLDVREDVPLFGFVGRLSHQKGTDLILETLSDMMRMEIQVVFLGVGESRYQEQLRQMALLYPKKAAAGFDFNEPLGHRIYAGSDFFLMPSRFEPCGLSQMVSLYYGTIPVVFKTGGLADTVKPFGPLNPNGNGLVFTQYAREDFGAAIKKAVHIFERKDKLYCSRQNALRSDFSWEQSARHYQEIYRCA